MKRLIYTSLFALLTVFTVQAQKVLTLEECINIALDNNINIKTARNNAISAKAGYTQSKFNFLPSLDLGASHRWNEGLDFDVTSGNLVNTTTLGGGASLSARLTIFNGFRNVFTLQQNKFAYEASEQNVRSNIQATEASIVSSFLLVVSTRENLKIQEQTMELLKEQLRREERREAAGVGNMEQVYNFRSQVAAQNLRIVNQSNQLKSSTLALTQLLLLDPSENYVFEGITINDEGLEKELENYASIYDRSVAYSPAIKTAELNLESSKKSLKISQYAWMPSLTMSASYGTNWSSNIRDFQTEIDPTTGETVFSRDMDNNRIDLGVRSLTTQFEDNVSKTANFNLNIPLFTRFNNRTNLQQSKIRMYNSELSLEQAKNTLTNQVQQAYLDLVNAKTSYAAAKESLVNLNTSFEFSKNRYESGTIDFVTYLQSLNGKNNGELELVRSKYEILFRQLIIDIYTGELNISGN